MSRLAWMLCGVFLINLAGCQCCRLTEHYAGLIDCISDHEHHYEVLYCPGWDLNRIGRGDWCSYRHNRLFCRCVCDRCKPAPCGYCVVMETGRVLPTVPNTISQPDWAQEPVPPAEPTPPAPVDDAADEDIEPPLPVPPAPNADADQD